MNRYAAACVVCVFFVVVNGTPCADIQAESSGTFRLPELIDEAVERNPEIIAAKERWSSAQEIIQARRAFPDPQLSYTYFVENLETRVGPQRHVFGAKQTLPFFGKRDLRADIATKQAEHLQDMYENTRQEVVLQVKRSFYDLFYITTAIDITGREKELLRRFERITRAKYETGRGLQQNILKVQVEINKLNKQLLILEEQKQTVEAMLNTLLSWPPARPLGTPERPELVEIPLGLEELLELAREGRPEVGAAKALIEKSERTYELAKKDYYPDLTIGFNYIEVGKRSIEVEDNGKDAFNFMFTVNLPIWRKKLSSQARSALKMITAQNSNYRTVLNQVQFEVKDNLFKLRTTRETIDLYESALIPRAEQSMEAAEAGYITGIVSFLDLLDAERVLLDIQFGYWQAYIDYLKRFADLERAVGTELAEYASGNTIRDTEEKKRWAKSATTEKRPGRLP
jgi:outer membrane protein TolC